MPSATPRDVEGMAAALERAAKLQPGEEARAAALPYAIASESARAADVLAACVKNG